MEQGNMSSKKVDEEEHKERSAALNKDRNTFEVKRKSA